MRPPDKDDDHPLDPSTCAQTADANSHRSTLGAGIPQRIGHYAIQSVVASGGMGTVYKAVQENPRRVVAIKVMRAGIASSSALRRFEFESQLLGRLRHPGIAQVYEAGTHQDETGPVPFFAMEYIPNARPITEYANKKNLGTRERLELFVKVCDAVHHGHQKSIVHRDLKPSNILVGPNGAPKVIDFGVARATDSDMALTAMQTDIGQLIGTVQYMSPEQCEADPDDIDTRSDVYALGVTLYELLCQRLPYRIERAPVYEATRMIRESNPDRPSTIDSSLRGDIETIVLKALEKERDRRYQSAADLGRDITNYLSGEAIAARPSSMAYQLRVFARRNKPAVAGVAAVLLIATISAVLITQATFRTEKTRLLAEQERLRAEQANMRAERESETAAVTGAFAQDVVRSQEFGEEVQVEELLDNYSASIEEHFVDQPLAEARMRSQLAWRYLFLALVQNTGQAEEHMASSLEHLNRALAIRQRELGDEHDETIQSYKQLAKILGFGADPEQALQIRRKVLEIRTGMHGHEAPQTLDAMSELASELRKQGRVAEAEGIAREEYQTNRRVRGEEDVATLISLRTLASIRQERGALAEAEGMCLQVLEGSRRVCEPESLSMRNAKSAMANIYVAQGKIELARAMYQFTVDPDKIGIEEWLSGELAVSNDSPTLIVFWEPWCPYSQVSVPNVQRLYSSYDEGALQVVGLVGLTKKSTKDQAMWFIERNELTFPNARSDRQLHKKFGSRGVPSAVALLDGEVVWEGHPAYISRSFLDGLIAGDVVGSP